jgi:hypothetical protein
MRTGKTGGKQGADDYIILVVLPVKTKRNGKQPEHGWNRAPLGNVRQPFFSPRNRRVH